MNSRIEKDFQFEAGLYYNSGFYINSYTATLSILVEEYTHELDPHIAMDRMIYYIENEIQNSLLIHSMEHEQIDLYKAAGLKLCILPDEPHDELVAAILVLKLNAIMEGRMRITDITLGTTLSGGIRYHVVTEVAESVLSGNHWWNKPCISVEDSSPGNVVKLFERSEWDEVGMNWKENTSI